MKQFLLVTVIPTLLSLAASEATELAPWLARRVMRKAAKLWAGKDHVRASMLAEEWEALINESPGKLTKLIRASTFVFSGLWQAQGRFLHRVETYTHEHGSLAPLLYAVGAGASLVLGIVELARIPIDDRSSTFFVALGGTVFFFIGLLAALHSANQGQREDRHIDQIPARHPAVEWAAGLSFCDGEVSARHAPVMLRGILVSSHVLFDPCPQCGALRVQALRRDGAIDSGR